MIKIDLLFADDFIGGNTSTYSLFWFQTAGLCFISYFHI